MNGREQEEEEERGGGGGGRGGGEEDYIQTHLAFHPINIINLNITTILKYPCLMLRIHTTPQPIYSLTFTLTTHTTTHFTPCPPPTHTLTHPHTTRTSPPATCEMSVSRLRSKVDVRLKVIFMLRVFLFLINFSYVKVS